MKGSDMKKAVALIITSGTISATAQEAVTVTTLYDVSDSPLATVLPQDLPGPDGVVSFREAVAATNNAAGPQTVTFAIPESEWWLLDDVALLELVDGPFLITDDHTTLDFSSQTDFTGDTNPNGGEVGIYGLQVNGWGHPAIFIYANHTTVKGLGPVYQRRLSVTVQDGNFNRFIGNTTDGIELDPYPGTTMGNIIGGTEEGEGNTLGSVEILCGANDNIVVGNTIREVNVVGSRYCEEGNEYPTNNRIGGPTPEERNVINGFGRRSGEGFPSGEGVLVTYAKDTLVEGNYIGVTADGMIRVNQIGTSGVRVYDAFDTMIRGNLISGIRALGSNHSAGQIFGQAIAVGSINADTYRTTIKGNLIGTDVTGENPIQTRSGIVVAPSTGLYTVHDTVIGGTNEGEANTIAYTEVRGVTVSALVDTATILGNSIFGNVGLGIDLYKIGLGESGVTPNDPGDADSGGNGLQNYPEINNVVASGSTMTVSGTFNSMPNQDYRLEFFASTECDQSGFGEGEWFVGAIEVTTDTNGDAPFDAVVDMAPNGMGFVTATATDLAANATSEFSACFGMATTTCVADVNGDGQLTPTDFTAWITAFNNKDSGCDQNDDGNCTPTDFTAWIANYQAGC